MSVYHWDDDPASMRWACGKVKKFGASGTDHPLHATCKNCIRSWRSLPVEMAERVLSDVASVK